MTDIIHVKRYVIEPVLRSIDMYSPAAVNLLIGTALVESGFEALHQRGGPALGIYQMEPATHDDMWVSWLAFKPFTKKAVNRWVIPEQARAEQLIGNLYYATAMARAHYYRRPEPLPSANDVQGLASYWKKYWNTVDGAGTVDRFIDVWRSKEEIING